MSATQSPVLEVSKLSARYGKVGALVGRHAHGAGGQHRHGDRRQRRRQVHRPEDHGLPLPQTGHAAGAVQYAGADVSGWQVERRVAAGMSLVPERRELFGSMSVEDNLLLGGFRRYRARESGWRDTLNEVFDLFPRLRERRGQQAGTLSGGERQMLAVGRALMAKPNLLMLDEPSLGLAPRIVREIFHIIARLRETGVAILLVEQNARAALQVADYGYVLETGEVILHGPARELAGDPKVIELPGPGQGGEQGAERPRASDPSSSQGKKAPAYGKPGAFSFRTKTSTTRKRSHTSIMSGA